MSQTHEGEKKQALVTGGTRGIGAAVSHALAAAGYEVLACGLTEAELAAFPENEGIRTQLLDVTDQDSVNSAVAACGRIDVLVNCAGIIQREGKEFTMEGFLKTIEVNLNGTMRMCLAAREKLAAAGGSIVNTASMLSFFGSRFAPAYTASKGGVAQLTKSLAAAWTPEGIRVNAVAPGWIETEFTQALREDRPRTEHILSRTPAGRWGKPEDIAPAVVFLASEDAGFITGVILPVDGGYMTV